MEISPSGAKSSLEYVCVVVSLWSSFVVVSILRIADIYVCVCVCYV